MPERMMLRRVAARYGTPVWVYDAAQLDAQINAWKSAFEGFDARICYAVKANGGLALLQRFARAGLGFDVVSCGELARVERAGGNASTVVFSGVGKRADEIDAALAAGVASINVESAAELELVNVRATAARLAAPVVLRVNPGVDAGTHPHIATGNHGDKFGIALDDAPAVARHAATLPGVALHGLALHIGSQLLDLAPLRIALDRVLALHDALCASGLKLRTLDVGGGLGVRYRDETPPPVDEYAALVRSAIGTRTLRVVVEPGRALVAEAGTLLTRVELVKPGFIVVDAGMSELIRPALYDAWHPIEVIDGQTEPSECDVVGPLCESGDVLGRARMLGAKRGDLLMVGCAGAYGASMSSHYNARPRAAEVLVDGDVIHEIRVRETIADLWRGETMLP
ncbi:MAG: diaminopimelate decarboxylase [Gammaproteobacteria bacterium]